MAQMKEQIKTPEKEVNKTEISKSDAEFKTLGIRMLEELSEDLNNIKKIQAEMKDSPMDIKNNLQETTVEWIKLRVKLMIWEIRKQKTTNQKKKKKEQFK